MSRTAYWAGIVAAVSGVVTALLLAVVVPVGERTTGTTPLLGTLAMAAITTGAITLVAVPIAALRGDRRLAAYGAVGLVAWALAFAFWIATSD
ncbi:MAG TPA: hypothetical protein VNA20_01200 [Frankiaceae bacterium]|nr:hypothetical protein [Frankiaceae bacterium]